MAHNPEQYVSMSIASLGDSTLPRQSNKPFQEKKINDVSDIDGARSGPKYQHFFNKPQFLQSDVQGSTSKPLSWARNVRDNSLYIDDIDGTRHSIKDRMMRTGRHVDPLAPSYPLPSFVPAEDPVPKFIKDSMEISDIDGTKPKFKKTFAPRDTMNIADIDGARPKKGYDSRPGYVYRFVCSSDHSGLHGHRPHYVDPGSLADTSMDVSAPNHRFKGAHLRVLVSISVHHLSLSSVSYCADRTSRVTDPNNPFYHINGMDYYDDKYTKPKPLKGYIADNHLLQTKDITGATPGFRSTRFERKEFRNINFVQVQLPRSVICPSAHCVMFGRNCMKRRTSRAPRRTPSSTASPRSARATPLPRSTSPWIPGRCWPPSFHR
jgi:hypothetical protein